MLLSELQPGQTAVIARILGHGAFRRRMIEMGFVKGRHITVMLQAPLNDPIKYSIMDYEVSLRRAEAAMVEVRVQEHKTANPGTEQETHLHHRHDGERNISVAFVGNPNCGKTTLFNVASGAHERTGNYSGVTVDAKTGVFMHEGYRFDIIDLPGTYSLTTYSPEEAYVRRYLRERHPDVIINIVDGSNLERNLYLTTELIDMNRPMVIALNMYDELTGSGATLDIRSLEGMIGVPIVPLVARTGQGVNELFDRVIDIYENRDRTVRHIHVTLGNEPERSVKTLNDMIKADISISPGFSPRYMAIKLLENDPETRREVASALTADALLAQRDREVERLRALFPGEDVTSLIAAEKYGFISGALRETLTPGDKVSTVDASRVIDALVTNKLFGFPIFFAVMFFMFWLTFEVGAYPMEWIEQGISLLSDAVNRFMPDGTLKDLVSDGIIGGVGGVIVFLPNILILYFCISFMEDSGYMARAAFIMDKVMHRMGIHGKSFIPLLMGFGCNVPAIMASRSIESRSSRLITILINPFMSCSARLPVYVLLVGAFFPEHAAWAFMGLYVTGILVAVLTARILRRFFFGTDETPFVMELPPYRLPTLKASLRHMWAKGQQYLRKMGGIILVASMVVWALNYFPRHSEQASTPDYVAQHSESTPDSYLQMMGKAVNPVMEPLGFTWRSTVAALAGVPAKEIVVSSLGVLYTGDGEASDHTLSARLKADNPTTGRPDFDPASALAFMVFILLYCPCLATVIAVVRESGHWGYGLFSVVYNTAVAWLCAWAVYRIALLF